MFCVAKIDAMIRPSLLVPALRQKQRSCYPGWIMSSRSTLSMPLGNRPHTYIEALPAPISSIRSFDIPRITGQHVPLLLNFARAIVFGVTVRAGRRARRRTRRNKGIPTRGYEQAAHGWNGSASRCTPGTSKAQRHWHRHLQPHRIREPDRIISA